MLSPLLLVYSPVRNNDISVLTRPLVQTKSTELGLLVTPGIAPGALTRLMKYNWPGNVREHQNVVERELIRYVALIRSGTVVGFIRNVQFEWRTIVSVFYDRCPEKNRFTFYDTFVPNFV